MYSLFSMKCLFKGLNVFVGWLSGYWVFSSEFHSSGRLPNWSLLWQKPQLLKYLGFSLKDILTIEFVYIPAMRGTLPTITVLPTSSSASVFMKVSIRSCKLVLATFSHKSIWPVMSLSLSKSKKQWNQIIKEWQQLTEQTLQRIRVESSMELSGY